MHAAKVISGDDENDGFLLAHFGQACMNAQVPISN